MREKEVLPDWLLAAAAVCAAAYVGIKRPDLLRGLLEIFDRPIAPALPPRPRRRVELATVQRRLEQLRRP